MLSPEQLQAIRTALRYLGIPFRGDDPEVRKILLAALAMKPDVRPLPYHRFGYPSYLEADRPTYNINRLPGTRLFISEGPAPYHGETEADYAWASQGGDPTAMPRFLQNTIFHPTDPIELFLVAGQPDEGSSFEDYFHAPRAYPGGISLEPIRPPVLNRAGGTILRHELLVRAPEESRRLELFQLPDMPDFATARLEPADLETLRELFLRVEHQNMNIHCAAGLGRSGLLALAYQLSREYEGLLARRTAQGRAELVADALSRLRQVRPGAVQTQAQLEQALEIATALVAPSR